MVRHSRGKPNSIKWGKTNKGRGLASQCLSYKPLLSLLPSTSMPPTPLPALILLSFLFQQDPRSSYGRALHDTNHYWFWNQAKNSNPGGHVTGCCVHAWGHPPVGSEHGLPLVCSLQTLHSVFRARVPSSLWNSSNLMN